MRGRDESWKEQSRIVLVGVSSVCVHVHTHTNVLCMSREGWGGVWVCVCLSGDGGKLFEQDVLTQCVQRDILPHIQTDGAHLQTEKQITSSQISINTERLRLIPIPDTSPSSQMNSYVAADAYKTL